MDRDAQTEKRFMGYYNSVFQSSSQHLSVRLNFLFYWVENYRNAEYANMMLLNRCFCMQSVWWSKQFLNRFSDCNLSSEAHK